MKQTVWYLMLLPFFMGCAGQVAPVQPALENVDIRAMLKSCDSLSCWTTQYESAFDKGENASWGTNVVYTGVYLVSADSIYAFSYPCDHWKTISYSIHGSQLFLENFPPQQFVLNADSIKLTYDQRVATIEDSTTLMREDIYAKQRVSAEILLLLLQEKHNDACDTMSSMIDAGGLLHFESLMNWIDPKY